MDAFPGIAEFSGRRNFPEGQWIQLGDGCPACERLGNATHQGEALAARQYEHSLGLLGVHDSLYIGEKVGNSLDLVKDCSLRKARKKAAGIALCKAPNIEVLQRGIGLVGKDVSNQSRLSGLPGTGQ